MRIRLVSMMAENADFLYRGMAAYLARRAGTAVETVEGVPWWERQRMLSEGEAHVGFLCGLVYAAWADRRAPEVELLGAPVPAGERYGERPVYFSDVVVRRESRFRSFASLRGASWAYNEPASHSGYNVTRWHLGRLGHSGGYFDTVVEAGAHLRALEMVLEGAVDAAAIDSTVLELEQANRPELVERLRPIHTLGPSPAPPGVVSTRLPGDLRAALRGALLSMHEDPEGARVLLRARLARYADVRDRDYDPIRRMGAIADGVRLGR